jgi:leucyl aminopeptidase
VTFGNKLETPKADSVLIVPVLPKKDSASSSSKKKPSPQVEFLLNPVDSAWQSLIENKVFSAQSKEVYFLRYASGAKHHVLLVGISPEAGHEGLRQAAASAFKALRREKVAHAIWPVEHRFFHSPEMIRAIVEGMGFANYEFKELKLSHQSTDQELPRLNLHLAGEFMSHKAAREAVSEAESVVKAVNWARRLGDLPGNYLPPRLLADEFQKAVSSLDHVKVQVWDKKRIEKERLGGLLAVSRGSVEEPRLIWAEYKSPKASNKSPLVLVGKGLTFDAGGISIKPSAGMEEMKYDMCGAAAVLGAFYLTASLQLPVHLVTLVPATENLPSGSAIKPGDVYVSRRGKTVEVNNTDAEGRLILGEALTLASELKPEAILDAATLTGAMVVALGNIHTGFFTRHSELAEAIKQAAQASGEKVWQMPLTDEHVEDMKGTFADINNISSSKGAGSATAAAFLEQFVDEGIPWAHFDIAGTAWAVGNRLNYCSPKGASGVMVRTFVEWIKARI